MQFPSMTPEQREALRAHMERTADLMRALVDSVKNLVRQAVPALRALADYIHRHRTRHQAPARDPLGLAYRAAAPRPRMTATTRPAWMSPYGPAPRRARA